MSEEKAERLYGAAPEGDEDPRALRAVPDPGERSGPFPFEAKYLSGAHLGQQMRVTDHDLNTSISGVLTGVNHGANLIADNTLFGPETYHIGRTWVQLTFSQSGARVSPRSTVELLG